MIGQITTEVDALPQQLAPIREGLEAWVKKTNNAGGICGRKIELESRNDTLVNAQDYYVALEASKFALVGTASLQDGSMYGGGKPFNPTSGGPDFMPDIGGQAFSYHRAQSDWHGSPLGSLSPVLAGGTGFVGFQQELQAEGEKCEFAGVLHLNEPTGASEDQAILGSAAIENSWGMGLGAGNSKLYAQELAATIVQYSLTVSQMQNDGVDCVFTYADLGSNINFVSAAAQQGAWPPSECTLQCFDLIYMPFTGYDPALIDALGDDAIDVRTFIPHVPIEESGNPAMAAYLAALKAVNSSYAPSTYSIVGYASGVMFGDALRACGEAPDRKCVMNQVRSMVDHDANGLMGPITPFKTTLGSWAEFGANFPFKWVFTCEVRMRVQKISGVVQYKRSGPASGFECGGLTVARSS